MRQSSILPIVLFCRLASLALTPRPAWAEPPQTAAEASDYAATSSHAQAVAFCQKLAKQSPRVRLSSLGKSPEGRDLPLLIVADPPIATAAEAAANKKLLLFAMANIHAGEVDGKEALLMLARDLALSQDRSLLEHATIVLAPIFNADGNERLGERRQDQAGPRLVGTRENAEALDLNRDFVKLETPEVRSLVRFFNAWNPALVVDCHTTNGSHHRYTLTYEGGRCPAGSQSLIEFTRDKLLPQAGKYLEEKTGCKSYFYGNFAADHARWETVLPQPRYGTHYVGLRNRFAALSESYSYAPFKDRVLATQAFVRGVFQTAVENRDAVRKLLVEPADRTERVAIRYKAAPVGKPTSLLGFVEEEKDGKRVSTGEPHEYEVQYYGGAEATLSVARPFAYLLPAELTKVVENLQRHGLHVEELREDLDLEIQVYKVDAIARGREFQRHEQVSLEATARTETRRVPAGTVLVRTAQPLGSLASHLLEPQSIDGLATWNFFDHVLQEGGDFPVLRLPAAVPLHAGLVRPLAEDRTFDKPITFDAVSAPGRGLSFAGSPATGQTWLDDGEHYLQQKEGQLCKVHALSGRATNYYDADALAGSLAKLPFMTRKAAQMLARNAWQRLSPQRDAALISHDADLYYAKLDGQGAVRLTHAPGEEELADFSPDGKLVSFVRANNLHVVDVATQSERALTSDGSETIFNGRADWVYFEEIFNRDRRAYWWSPDSSHIAFLRIDDAPVRTYTIVDPTASRQKPENTPYPKAGAPNPLASLGLVAVAGGSPRFADLADYSETSSLVIRAGWLADSQTAYFYVQDRAQTWLDFCTVPRDGGEPTRLFRETTKAWVNDPGAPHFLKDGSFLLASERTGWRHLYRFAKDGKLLGAVTSGDWEARTLHEVDEAAGWVYFSGTRDSHLGSNLYRVQLDGSRLERLTATAGDHRVNVSPKANLFIDAWSDHKTPTQVRLHAADGSPVRTLDTNPVYAVEEYRRGNYQLVQIPASDGFALEASLLTSPNFDSRQKHPVWFMTYGGPHAPTITDSWGGGRVRDEMLAQLGFIVFRADPRSASGKGECTAWTAYKRLGVPELKDIETAIAWLKTHEFVDGDRIGMSGHSYGGFMTAYAMTHSQLFAAGIAGAPVTDWRNYDSIYTERYMNTPQENPSGYNETSVVRAAGNLHGKLLLVHGLIDDNVHAQNSLQLLEALQKADKDFEVMVYPHSRHGIVDRHYSRLQVDFMKRALNVR